MYYSAKYPLCKESTGRKVSPKPPGSHQTLSLLLASLQFPFFPSSLLSPSTPSLLISPFLSSLFPHPFLFFLLYHSFDFTLCKNPAGFCCVRSSHTVSILSAAPACWCDAVDASKSLVQFWPPLWLFFIFLLCRRARQVFFLICRHQWRRIVQVEAAKMNKNPKNRKSKTKKAASNTTKKDSKRVLFLGQVLAKKKKERDEKRKEKKRK